MLRGSGCAIAELGADLWDLWCFGRSAAQPATEADSGSLSGGQLKAVTREDMQPSGAGPGDARVGGPVCGEALV